MSIEKDIKSLVGMSNKYGADAEFVLAGGGNTSYKRTQRRSYQENK